MIRKTLFLGIAAFSLFACNTHDDNTNDNIDKKSRTANNKITEASIVGKWQPFKYAIYSGKDGSSIKSSAPNVCEQKGFLELTSNGKLHETGYEGTVEAECQLDFDITADYTYDNSSKKILLTHPDGTTEIYNINRVTDSELESLQELTDVNGDGIKDQVTAIYKRL